MLDVVVNQTAFADIQSAEEHMQFKNTKTLNETSVGHHISQAA